MPRAWEAERAIPRDAQTQFGTRGRQNTAPVPKTCQCPFLVHVIPHQKCPRFVQNRSVPWLRCGREGRSFNILPALSPRMIAGRRAMRPACRSRGFRGWGCRGRGSAPSSAPRRRRSQGNFAKRQALSAIVNDDVSWLVLPHPPSALSRRPVTILPRELQQAVCVTHHPVFTEHSFSLQPEHVVQLSRRGTFPMIVIFSRRQSPVLAIVLGDVMLLQISIGIVIVAAVASRSFLTSRS